MIPVSFDHCAGWLHQASGGRGVIICGSFGFEDLCSHRSLAVLAEKIALAGQPALRFDWSGCGDSAGSLSDPGLVDRWRGNLRAAIAFMTDMVGVGEIALVGLRAGASLAAEIAAEHGGVARLAMIAPPASGKSFVRELKALSRLTAVEGDEAAPGALAVAGFHIPAEAVASLQAIVPAALAAAPARHVLALGREDMSGHPLVDHLRGPGREVAAGVFEGYDSMMCDPTASQTPEGSLDRVAKWVVEGAGADRRVHTASPPDGVRGPGFEENRVCFGADHKLAGVWCRPSSGLTGQAVIFLNAGAIHHVGWARGHVDMARGLALAGVASLRMDLGGMGDSFAARDAGGSLYARDLKQDVSAAIDWLECQGIADIAVLGACSGACHALQAALEDSRVSRLVLVNQLCFVWGPTYAIQLSAWRATKAAVVGAALNADAEAANEAAKLLNSLLPVARKFARGSFRALMGLASLATSGFTNGNVVEDWFESLSGRGARISLVYSEGDAGLAELERWLGPEGLRALALPGVEKHVIPGADHMLTQAPARRALGEHVLAILGARGPRESKEAEAA